MFKSAYNCKHPRGVMSISASKPKKNPVSSASASHFVPKRMPVAYQTRGGRSKGE